MFKRRWLSEAIAAAWFLLVGAVSAHAAEMRVAVLGLRDEMQVPAAAYQRLDGALSQAIIERLGETYRVISPSVLPGTHEVQELLKPCANRSCERDRGARLGCDYLLSGDVAKLPAGLRIRLRAYQMAGNDFLIEEVVMAPNPAGLESQIAGLTAKVCARVVSDARARRPVDPNTAWGDFKPSKDEKVSSLAESGTPSPSPSPSPDPYQRAREEINKRSEEHPPAPVRITTPTTVMGVRGSLSPPANPNASPMSEGTADPAPGPSPSPTPDPYKQIREAITKKMQEHPPIRIRTPPAVMSEGANSGGADVSPLTADKLEAGGGSGEPGPSIDHMIKTHPAAGSGVRGALDPPLNPNVSQAAASATETDGELAPMADLGAISYGEIITREKQMWLPVRGSCTFTIAMRVAANCTVGGYQDWKLPTSVELLELYDPNVSTRIIFREDGKAVSRTVHIVPPFKINQEYFWSRDECYACQPLYDENREYYFMDFASGDVKSTNRYSILGLFLVRDVK